MPNNENNLVTSKLAARLGTAHLELHEFLDHEAERAAAIVDSYAWKLVKLANQQPPLHPYQLEMEVRNLLDKLPNVIGKRVYDSLMKCGKKSTDLAAEAIVRSVPLKYMIGRFEVQEAAGGAILRAIIKPFKRKEPVAKLVDVKRSFRDYLIAPLKKGVIEKIVLGGAAIIAKLMQTVKQAINPKKIADILVKGISQSKNRHQQARDLINELAIPRSAAKRIVRTEGARVATESNMNSYEKLGTAVIGYMIHATPNPDSRWWHRQRSGTVYYKEPTEGQKGLAQMPRPPMEAKDPKERPEDAPEVAHNCLCYISPVWQPLDEVDTLLSKLANHKVVPDNLVYADWFSTTTEKLKRRAVGSRRYDLVTKMHGENASYFHYIDPETGEMMALDALAKETADETRKRVDIGRNIANDRRKARRDVLLFGGLQ